MYGPEDPWDEDDDGPIVRLFAVTRGRGRTTGRRELTLDTRVVDRGAGLAPQRTEPEYVDIIRLCRTAQSVAEISAQLRLPLALAKVLVGDLIDDGRLEVRPPFETTIDPARDIDLLHSIARSLREV
ncbi:DUF742 domain-containing protein [Nocardia flavorosea]|uniref:DUF742 domain-containing protein n=1 Tax=Nocardia flavorosea TaxID=53429 RepID=UPI001894C0D2|nr:DUF742 domain-containing protein [Nocardia flavorosea]MBF6351477.1 DUF742 domain-containing protein [Nocardia flavorosea]